MQSTYKKQVLLPQKRRAYQELFVLILFIGVFVNSIPWSETYDKETYRMSEFIKNRGCVWYLCPKVIQEEMFEEHNGLYPPAAYKWDSKKWWNSFCTYSPENCIY